jgi:hypothetical protein
MDEAAQAGKVTLEWWRAVENISCEEGKLGAKAAMACACLEDLVALEDADLRRSVLVSILAASGLHALMQNELNAWAQSN